MIEYAETHIKKYSRHLYDAALFIIAAALYSPALQCGFVGDDSIFFIGNQHIRSFDVLTILRSGAIGVDYAPFRDLSFALDYMLWGENPFGFHLTSVVLFGSTVVAVKHLFVGLNAYLSDPRSKDAQVPAFLAALVFAVHPNHREVVYAIFNRGALLTMIFSVLTCLMFLRFLSGHSGRYRSYAAALLCYLFTILSREYGLVLPMVLVVLIYFDDRSKRLSSFIHTAPFFLMAAVYYVIFKNIAVTAGYISPSPEPLVDQIISRTAVAIKIMLFYIVRMATSLGNFTLDDSLVFAGISAVIIGGLLFAAIRLRHTHPQLLFGLLFYLVCLVPVLNIFRTFPIVTPRYSFLPCVGLFYMLTAVPHEGKKRYIPAAVVVFTLLWSLLTMQKTHYWKDNIAFWELIAPRDKTPLAYSQLGYAYYDGRQYEKALEMLRKVQPVPFDAKYHAMVGKACLKLGDWECAIRSFEAAMSMGVNDGAVLLELAGAHLARGDGNGAEKYFDLVRRDFPQMKGEIEAIKAASPLDSR